MSATRSITIATLAVLLMVGGVLAQTKRRTRPVVKKPAVTNVAPAPSASPVEAAAKNEPKKNERPGAVSAVSPLAGASEPTYFYEFAQPEFAISKIVIEHDDSGRGTITFTKKMFGDSVTDPIQISAEALERIKSAYTTLNFVDSNENYQYERDYSHLGVMTFRVKKGDKQRTAVFNYTTNKTARILMEEYRRIGNQFIWLFDIGVARENQPLETPKLLEALEGFLKRSELSDPMQLVELLRGMIDDERVPLISRNHARKLAEKIEKTKK
jgi:hypothetical protein